MKYKRPFLFMIGVLLGLGLAAGGYMWLAKRNGTATKHTPAVLFLSPVDAPELWSTGLDGQNRRQLTQTGGKVYDYAVSGDGSRIVYAAGNALKGMDLWSAAPDGSNPRLLIDCGADQCVEPAVSPDGKQVAYSRRSAAENPGGSPALGRIWIFTLADGSHHVLEGDALVNGSKPDWSPDGAHLAFYDPKNAAIRVRQVSGGQDLIYPSGAQSTVSWSTDGRVLVFADSEQTPDSPQGKLIAVDIQSGNTMQLLEDVQNADFSSPQWSPNGDWIVLGVIPFGQGGGRQIWLVAADGKSYKEFTADWHYGNAAYAWSPDGTYLLSQQFALGASDNQPDVILWTVSSRQPSMLAHNAALPAWLP
jgi:TolB protein